MSFMPIIDDRMFVLLQRTGKRRTSYASAQRGRVVPQRSGGCRHVNDYCRGPNGAIGVCDRNLDCVMDIDDGDFRLPQFQ